MTLNTDIIILLVLLALSGFFSGAEVALISLSDAKVKEIMKRKGGGLYIKRLKDNPQRMLSTILIGNNVVNIGAASLMTVVMINIFGNYAVGIATGVMTLLILVFGEITPKTIASQHNEKFALIVARPLWWLSIVLKPILAALDLFLNAFLKLFGIKSQRPVITEDEIKHMVAAAEEEGSIKKIEKKLIHNVFEFDETHVGEVMTPKADIVSIPDDATVRSALKTIAEKRHSRMPVYNNQKEIVGVLSLRDLLEQDEEIPVKNLMRQPYVVPESKPISGLLRKFQKKKEHLAIVVNEHGSHIGIVTLEDVLEKIVGEIIDDAEVHEPHIKKSNKQTWNVKGKTSIQAVNEKLGINLPQGEYDTLSGFILQRLTHIPKKGEQITFKEFTLQVQEIKKHRIERVLIKK